MTARHDVQYAAECRVGWVLVASVIEQYRQSMANKKTEVDSDVRRPRYEFRVWGAHRKARRKLARLASAKTNERVKDCYLIVDDPSWNAKVRNNALEVKQLVAENKGFEQWSHNKHRSSATVPSPFDLVFEELRLDRAQRGRKYDLAKAVAKLEPGSGVRAVFVTKQRRRYRVGGVRAEVTDIKIHATGETLRTLSFEGDNLKELVALRKRLGVRDEPNVAVHQAIETEIRD